MKRKLVAALVCRNQGSRLFGKPLQNLDIEAEYCILDNIIQCLQSISCIDEIILGISEGIENEIFKRYAEKYHLKYIVGDQNDVLSRLIQCGNAGEATDIFRTTTESPFLFFDPVESLWDQHVKEKADATFLDNIIDGCGFEIISLVALEESHKKGENRHRSELCTLYIRENADNYHIIREYPPSEMVRRDLRLTVDNPEDLIVCRNAYMALKSYAPRIPINLIVNFLDLNPFLIQLITPYTEQGYSLMYK